MAKKAELLSPRYEAVQVVPGSDVLAGDIATIDDSYGFYLTDVTSGDTAALIVKAEQVKVEKATGAAWNVGDAIYWHTTNLNFVNVATGAVLVGRANQAALTADTEGYINFDGFAAFLKL